MEGSFGCSLDDDLLCAVEEAEHEYLNNRNIIHNAFEGQRDLQDGDACVSLSLEDKINSSDIENEPITIHGTKQLRSSQVNRQYLENSLNISNFASPMFKSTPANISCKSTRKRLSKGHKRRSSLTEISSRSTPRRRVTRQSPLTSRRNTENQDRLGVHEQGSCGARQNLRSSSDGTQASRLRFQNLIAGSDSDTDSEGHEVPTETCVDVEGPTLQVIVEDKENEAVDLKSQKTEQHTHAGQSTHTDQPSPDAARTDHKPQGLVGVTETSDRLALSSWGLPEVVLQRYRDNNITRMFEWQAECLCTGNVLSGGNLVYSAPTSAGKTMVAELLILKQIVETKRKAIFILPFVSVVREKMLNLQNLWQDAGIRVQGYMGHISAAGGFQALDVAVCTIEKANSLVNRLIEEGQLNQLGVVVVDELHMVGDSSRGYLLELLLTKIQYVTSSVQVIGMSATLPNLGLLARWLKADLFDTDYRPVPLTESVKVSSVLYDCGMRKVRDIDASKAVKGDEDHITQLCLETILEGCSVLIFCPTKNWCETLATTIARQFYNLYKLALPQDGSGFVPASTLMTVPLNRKSLNDVVEQLRRSPVGLDSVLAKCVPWGTAYHHAGLTFDERDIVEGAFRQGFLKVLVATSTLSSGVNLPAKRVIVRSPTFRGQVIDTLTYKQMVGRAGRKGVDTSGESILICKPNERSKATSLLKSSLPPVHSCLSMGDGESLSSSLKRAILEVVVSGVASTPDDVQRYAKCTLLAAECDAEEERSADERRRVEEGRGDTVTAAVRFLTESELISIASVTEPDGTTTDKYFPSQLGAAVLASALSPDEGLIVFTELQKARRNFVLENELHIVYQVTPIYMQSENIDWYQFMCMWESLPLDQRRVAECVGVKESFLARAVRGKIPLKTTEQLRLVNVHKRFYTALVLHDLVHEVPLGEVAKKYQYNKGSLQSLQQSAATFAGMVTVFCAKLGWTSLELLLSQFQSRLTFGVQRELVDLVRISLLTAQRARALYNAGYQTVAMVANASSPDVQHALRNAVPFDSKKRGEGETDWEAAERVKVRCIWMTGQKGLTEHEAAVLVIQEARKLLQEDLGTPDVQWENPESNKTRHTSRPSLPRHNTARKRASLGKTKSPASLVTRIQSPNTSKKSDISGSILSPPPAMRRSMLELKSPPAGGQVKCKAAHARNQRVSSSEYLSSSSHSTSLVVRDKTPKPRARRTTRQNRAQTKQSPTNTDTNLCTNGEDDHTLKEVKKETVIKKNRALCSGDEQNTVLKSQTNLVENVLQVSEESSNLKRDMRTARERRSVSEGRCLRSVDDKTAVQDTTALSSLNAQVTPQVPTMLTADRLLTELTERVSTPKATETPEPHSKGHCRKVSVSATVICRNQMFEQQTAYQENQAHELSGSQVLDLSHDWALDEYMQQFCTQKAMDGEHGEACLKEKASLEEEACLNGEACLKEKASLEEEACLEETCDLLHTSIDELNQAVAVDDSALTSQAKPKSPSQLLSSFTDSPDLVASNYERLGVSVDGGFFDLNGAQDQHMVSPEGLLLGEVMDTQAMPPPTSTRTGKKRPTVSSNQSRASPGRSESTDSTAVEMTDDSFTPSMASLALGMLEGTRNRELDQTRNSGKTRTSRKSGRKMNPPGTLSVLDTNPCDSQKEMGDSLTYSMITKVFDCATSALRGVLDSTTCEHIQEANLSPKQSDKRSQEKSGDNGGSGSRPDRRAGSDCVPPTPPDPEKIDRTKTPNKPSRREKRKSPRVNAIHSSTKKRKTHKVSGRVIEKETCKRQSPGKQEDVNDVTSQDKSSTSVLPMSQSFSIIDVAASKVLFDHFVQEWRNQRCFTLSLACEKTPAQAAGHIGSNHNKDPTEGQRTDVDGLQVEGKNLRIVGLAVSWTNRDSYYIALTSRNVRDNLEESLLPASLDDSISVESRLNAIRSVLHDAPSRKAQKNNSMQTKVMFDMKSQYKLLAQVCGISVAGPWRDPKLAAWLLDPGAPDCNLHRLVHNYAPPDAHLLEGLGGGVGVGSVGVNPDNPGSGRVRACTEAVLVNQLHKNLLQQLDEQHLTTTYTLVEMPTLILLARMELNGFGFSDIECENQKGTLQSRLSSIEEEAYQLAGHPFSLTSTEDISQVLYTELRLPPSGDPSVPTVIKTLGPARRAPGARGRAKTQLSTSKDILEKLKKLHSLPGLILEWRRVNSALSKVVFPLQKEKQFDSLLNMHRIYGLCQTHTATGRVTMSEPNLQSIPRDFDVLLPGGASTSCRPDVSSVSVSMRHAFVPFSGGVLIAADYSQLELRLIAHLSRDPKLVSILNGEGDVFTTIAAQWRDVGTQHVTAQQRQQTKQICYGMIYGIGPKALAEQLGVEENDATVFIETFKAKYTGMRKYLQDCVTTCRERGFVETITGRRRYLPAIKDNNIYARSHAERQAVNTTVQGSAADLVKKAMVFIDERLRDTYPAAPLSHRHSVALSEDVRRKSERLASRGCATRPPGTSLVLQLHDELIYEVPEKEMTRTARIIRDCMETAMKLSVKLPVKVKAGPSWGTLHDIDLKPE